MNQQYPDTIDDFWLARQREEAWRQARSYSKARRSNRLWILVPVVALILAGLALPLWANTPALKQAFPPFMAKIYEVAPLPIGHQGMAIIFDPDGLTLQSAGHRWHLVDWAVMDKASCAYRGHSLKTEDI